MILYRAMYDVIFDKTGKSIDSGEIVTLDEYRKISGQPEASGFIPFFEFIDTEDPECPYCKIQKKIQEVQKEQRLLDAGYVKIHWEV